MGRTISVGPSLSTRCGVAASTLVMGELPDDAPEWFY